MLAMKCDICGNFYIDETPSDQQQILMPSSIVFEYRSNLDGLLRGGKKKYDICPKCYLAVKNVLESRMNGVKRSNNPA